MKRILLLLSFFALAVPLRSQTGEAMLSVPFDFGLLLSGNFGELRSNHFHSGVDFKTQGVVGKPIKCVADGYISRATVQPGGYGQAIYVIHDNGYMTVYGHLERFPEAVGQRVREAQYENESFSVDISFAPDEFMVKRGDFLAVAGNSGYSFGPHLHFEVRDTAGNELYDPMPFYAGRLKDRRPPVASEIAVYPASGMGTVDTLGVSRVYKVDGGTVNDTIDVWGRVGFGVKALDYMDGVNNKYGSCYCDNSDHNELGVLDNFVLGSPNDLLHLACDILAELAELFPEAFEEILFFSCLVCHNLTILS